MPNDETNIAAWPRLKRVEDLLVWASQLMDRLRYLDTWIVSGRNLKPRNPNWIIDVPSTGGPPTGAAGGDLTGSYPAPTIRAGAVGNAEITDVAWEKVTGAPSQIVAYRHVQATAATVWNISHGLSFRPNVTAVDSTGREMWPGTVDYPSASSVTLTFSAAVGGEAYLS